MKYGPILVYLKNIFWLNHGDWKLVPDRFIILME